MKTKRNKTILGRTALIDFPELDLIQVEAKVDTGAYSTALHSEKFWVEAIDGVPHLHFEVYSNASKRKEKKTLKTPKFKQKAIRSSNGKKEIRYVFKTLILLGGKSRKTDVSLSNRKKMKYPVLLGRKVLKNGFLVDVSLKHES